jgi:hypothetical protein
VGSVAQLWNSRSKHGLRRHWISFQDRIIIGGAYLEQTGVLSVQRAREGGLCARLRVMGRELEEVVKPGNDIAVWINGLELIIGVKAVDDEHMLAVFGIQPGSNVTVTLEPGAGADADADAETAPGEYDGANGDLLGHIGLRQIRL